MECKEADVVSRYENSYAIDIFYTKAVNLEKNYGCGVKFIQMSL